MMRSSFTLWVVAAAMLSVFALPLGRHLGRLDAAQGVASPAASPMAPPVGSPAATQGSPLDLGFQLPAGITLALLGGGLADTLPATPARLRLERLAIPAKADLGTCQTAGPELLYVESGSLVLVDESGLEGTYNQGGQVLLPGGTSYGIRNDAAQPGALLRLTLTPASAPAAAVPNATPGTVATTTDLLRADVKTLPAAPARVFLARLTWAPGAALAEHTFAGESGSLTVVASGITAQLPPGKGIVFQPGVRNQERNDTNAPVTTLMAGVVAANESPVLAVPTPTLPPTVAPRGRRSPRPRPPSAKLQGRDSSRPAAAPQGRRPGPSARRRTMHARIARRVEDAGPWPTG